MKSERDAVAVLSLYYPPDFGGASARVGAQISAISRTGMFPVIFSSYPQYPYGKITDDYAGRGVILEKSDIADVWRFPIPQLPSKGIAAKLVLFAYYCVMAFLLALAKGRSYKISAVYAIHPVILSFFPGFLLSRYWRVPLVLGAPDLWPEEIAVMPGFLARVATVMGIPIARFAYKVSDAILTVSHSASQIIQEKYGVPATKTFVMYGPVDTSLIKPISTSDARSILSKTKSIVFSPRDFVVMYLGVLSPSHDFRVILEAAEMLGTHVNILFYIVGGGELDAWLSNEVKRRNLQNIRLIPIQPKSLVSTLLSAADFCILPLANNEIYKIALTSKFSEYISCGRPVIFVGPEGDASWLLNAWKCGFYCPPNQSSLLAELILDYSSRREELGEIGRRARELAESEFSIQAAATIFADIFLDSRREEGKTQQPTMLEALLSDQKGRR